MSEQPVEEETGSENDKDHDDLVNEQVREYEVNPEALPPTEE